MIANSVPKRSTIQCKAPDRHSWVVCQTWSHWPACFFVQTTAAYAQFLTASMRGLIQDHRNHTKQSNLMLLGDMWALHLGMPTVRIRPERGAAMLSLNVALR
eukprot:4667193-Amphidinium_carterae.1